MPGVVVDFLEWGWAMDFAGTMLLTGAWSFDIIIAAGCVTTEYCLLEVPKWWNWQTR